MRKGYTLIEIIITIAITGILSIGMFKAFEAITLRSEKAKILTTLSIDSQTALDQISILLYNRVPMSTQGCTLNAGCVPLDQSINNTILTWYGTASESYLAGDYSGFVDIEASMSTKPVLQSPNTNLGNVLATERNKWGNTFLLTDMGLVFSSPFDQGEQLTYTIANSGADTIQITNPTADMTISEKYSLIDSAYAVARGADIDPTAPCITALGISANAIDNTLFLFYDYRPWKTPAESFCADTANRAGKVSILATNVNAFRAQVLNSTIRLSIDTNRTVRGGNPVRLSKQKVVF